MDIRTVLIILGSVLCFGGIVYFTICYAVKMTCKSIGGALVPAFVEAAKSIRRIE